MVGEEMRMGNANETKRGRIKVRFGITVEWLGSEP